MQSIDHSRRRVGGPCAPRAVALRPSTRRAGAPAHLSTASFLVGRPRLFERDGGIPRREKLDVAAAANARSPMQLCWLLPETLALKRRGGDGARSHERQRVATADWDARSGIGRKNRAAGLAAARPLRALRPMPPRAGGDSPRSLGDRVRLAGSRRAAEVLRGCAGSVSGGADGWPVLFFLHGRGRTPRSLVDLEPMRQVFQGAPFCTVFPQGDDGWYIDSPVDPQGRCEADLEETIALAGRVRPLSRTRERRAITGWSMGGYGAVRFAIRHPDEFGVVAGIIALLDFPRPADLPEGQNYAVPVARFGTDPAVWLRFNPLPEAAALWGRAVFILTAPTRSIAPGTSVFTRDSGNSDPTSSGPARSAHLRRRAGGGAPVVNFVAAVSIEPAVGPNRQLQPLNS